MNKIILISSFITILVISGCSSGTIGPKKIFNNLQWIEGKWVSVDVTNYTEVWKRVNDTLYQGLAISPSESDSLVEERPKIVLRNNDIHFISEVEEQTVEGMTQDFKLTSSSPDTLVFANNDSNYPNRITYKRINDTTIKVNVERKGDGNQIKFEYTLKKAK